MPQIIIDYSTNLEGSLAAQTLVENVHSAIATEGTWKPELIRTRCASPKTFLAGRGTAQEAFVHITFRIKAGRPVEFRKRIGKLLFECVQKHIQSQVPQMKVILSVEIQEIDPETYLMA